MFEFCVENLVFYETVDQFRESGGVKQAFEIWNKFIKIDSAYEVNISSKTRQRVHELLSKYGDLESGKLTSDAFDESIEHIFDETQEEVLEMMKNNSFIRYKAWLKKNEFRASWQSADQDTLTSNQIEAQPSQVQVQPGIDSI
jgi:hypothetical protein